MLDRYVDHRSRASTGARPQLDHPAELGLDQPVLARYGEWLLSALRGDLGVSWFSNQPVAVLLGQALPATLSIVLGSVLVTALIGTLIGASAAVREAYLGHEV